MARIRISGPVISLMLGVLVLAGGLATAVGQVFTLRRLRGQVLRDTLLLIAAVQRYDRVYQRMPSGFNGYYDVEYGGTLQYPNRMVMNVLHARDALGNSGHGLNPQRIVFITNQVARAGQSGVNADLEWMDPWGKAYRMVLDTDGDRVCNVDGSIHHAYPAIATRAALWSAGPDRKYNTTDDLLGWRMLYEREQRLRR